VIANNELAIVEVLALADIPEEPVWALDSGTLLTRRGSRAALLLKGHDGLDTLSGDLGGLAVVAVLAGADEFEELTTLQGRIDVVPFKKAK